MGNSQQVLSQQCRMKEKWIKQNLAAHTFLKYVEEYLPVSAQSSEGDGLPGRSSVQVHHLLFSGPLHSDPLPAIPENTKLQSETWITMCLIDLWEEVKTAAHWM